MWAATPRSTTAHGSAPGPDVDAPHSGWLQRKPARWASTLLHARGEVVAHSRHGTDRKGTGLVIRKCGQGGAGPLIVQPSAARRTFMACAEMCPLADWWPLPGLSVKPVQCCEPKALLVLLAGHDARRAHSALRSSRGIPVARPLMTGSVTTCAPGCLPPTASFAAASWLRSRARCVPDRAVPPCTSTDDGGQLSLC